MERLQDRIHGAHLVEKFEIYDDGWCAPACAVRVRAAADASRVEVSIWTKEEAGAPESIPFEVHLEGLALEQVIVEPGKQSKAEVEHHCRAGDELVLSLRCKNVVRERGSDIRDLSFVLLQLRLR